MRFIVRQRRQMPPIIIVALIDVLIVIVIFLTVTTTFKQQPALRLALPESTQAERTGAHEDAPLVVTVDAEGFLRVGPDGRPVTVEGLKHLLRTQVAGNPQLKLAINADRRAPFGQIIKVMDAAKEANIRMVNAFTKESGRP